VRDRFPVRAPGIFDPGVIENLQIDFLRVTRQVATHRLGKIRD